MTDKTKTLTSLRLVYVFLAMGLLARNLLAEEKVTESLEKTPIGIKDEEFLLMEEGEGLTFIATLEASQQVRRIDKEEIQRLQAPDTISLLEKAFHVGITRNGAYGSVSGVSLRGYGSGRVAILLDGVPVNSSQTGGFDLNRISPEDLEAVEVIYGGSDMKFAVSGAQGGVINLITRRKKEEGMRWSVTMTNQFFLPEPYVTRTGDRVWPPITDVLDTQKLRFDYETNLKEQGFKAGMELVRAENHFLFQDPNYKVRRWDGAEVKELRGDTSYIWESATNTLFWKGSFYWGDKNIPGSLNSSKPGVQKDFYGKTTLQHKWERISGTVSRLETAFDYSYEGTRYTDLTGDTNQRLHTLQGSHRWEILWDSSLILRPSIDGTFAYLDSSNIGFKTLPQGGIALGVEYSLDHGVRIFPYLKVLITEAMVMPVPKLGLLFQLSDSVTLKNNWYRTFRLPTLNDLYWPEDSFAKGNPDLRPEDGWGGDVVLELKNPGSYTLDTSFYVTYQKDAISWQPTSGEKWMPMNIAEALFFGSDTRIASDFHPTFKITASYSWLLSYVLTGELTIGDDKRMPYQPMHRFGVGLEILWSTGSLVIEQKYESERYSTIVNATPLHPYFTIGVSFTQQLGGNWIFLLSGSNLLGANYQLIKDYPLPRTTISVGVRYTEASRQRKGR
ncbi:MAG: TonB-dependent receptor [Spirochaetes bacterium]|nr:TonB-dependent receptor [Spirochaetota bacterium]